MADRRKYRVIQWATGNIGSRSLLRVIEHPDMELVGLWVSSPDKVGKDAGELAGASQNVGIAATNTAAELIAIDADCVLYMGAHTNWDELCAILASGKNVITTRGDFHYPPMIAPENRARIEEACRVGNTSIHSTGSSPGFVTEAFVLPLLSIARSHELLTIHEYADVSSRASPEMLFHVMGFGAEVGPVDPRRAAHLKDNFGSSLSQIAEAIGLPVDEIEAGGELSATKNTLNIAAGTVAAGTVGAMRTTITAKHKGREVIRFRANWYVTTDIQDEWNLRDSGWRVQTEGDTPLLVDVHFPVAAEDYADFTPGLTAHRPVNAIPVVCAAAPGIRTTADLPQIIPTFR